MYTWADLAWGQGGSSPPTPRNSMESRGKKEGEEGERKERGRRKGGWRKKKGDEPPKRQIVDPPLASADPGPTGARGMKGALCPPNQEHQSLSMESSRCSEKGAKLKGD